MTFNQFQKSKQIITLDGASYYIYNDRYLIEIIPTNSITLERYGITLGMYTTSSTSLYQIEHLLYNNLDNTADRSRVA